MENKTSKYFKYAIGEIILVVIGILIALQINNWNIAKNNNTYVSLILKEIYYDLSDDYRIIYRGVEPRLERKSLGVEKIKEFMVKGEVPSDSIFMLYYNEMMRWFILTQRTGAFESLKLGGLDKIDNDMLRTRLLEFYESDLPRSVNFIHQADVLIRERVGVLEADLFNFKFIAVNDSTTAHVMFPKDMSYIHHQSLHKIYDLLSHDTYNKVFRLKQLKRNYNNVMQMIEKELEKRKIEFEYFDTSTLKRDFEQKS
ncbi:DUF6090 family protein [Geojedonia litorea]|uniref:DUF6090 family protein n=1 Tax=Geojedonia litorea TaxID=1268269 RepID=A0ABV9MY22_9FLAO